MDVHRIGVVGLGAMGAGIAQVAVEVGYESEAAFSRAFKRHLGMPPGAWRQSNLLARAG